MGAQLLLPKKKYLKKKKSVLTRQTARPFLWNHICLKSNVPIQNQMIINNNDNVKKQS